jgi:hypothetical protein
MADAKSNAAKTDKDDDYAIFDSWLTINQRTHFASDEHKPSLVNGEEEIGQIWTLYEFWVAVEEHRKMYPIPM